MVKKYEIEDGDYVIEVPRDIQKQIVSDHLEKYYIGALTTGMFLIGFLLGVISYAL